MTLEELIAQFRTDADDTARPYLWGDDDLIRWFNEAVNETCRRSHLLVDSSTAAIVTLTLPISTPFVTYDPRIIRIRRARPTGDVPVGVITSKELDQSLNNWEEETGDRLRAIVTDMSSYQIRVYPILTQEVTLNLTVSRQQLTPLVALTDVPEIPELYHLKIIPWVLHKAFSVDDIDAKDEAKAEKSLAAFNAEFATTSAQQEQLLRTVAGRDLVTGTFVP